MTRALTVCFIFVFSAAGAEMYLIMFHTKAQKSGARCQARIKPWTAWENDNSYSPGIPTDVRVGPAGVFNVQGSTVNLNFSRASRPTLTQNRSHASQGMGFWSCEDSDIVQSIQRWPALMALYKRYRSRWSTRCGYLLMETYRDYLARASCFIVVTYPCNL